MTNLKASLQKSDLVIAPGIYDALSALLAEQAGFQCLYLSGASIAYTRLGRPDIGLVSMSEVAETIGRLRERTDLPLIVDADTGFGNALNVQRSVALMEKMGADCIQLEDQQMPKRCGHLRGKQVVSVEEMAGKIRAATDIRRSESLLIMARTDAIAVEGFDAAMERAEKYCEAGADVLFIEAPESLEQMQSLSGQFRGRIPLLANMVEGGRTPVSDIAMVRELGYAIAIYPGALVRVLSQAATEFLGTLRRDGDTQSFQHKMFSFSELQEILGTDEMLKRGKLYE